MDKVQSQSIVYYDNLKKHINAKKPSMFPGQNLVQMSKVYLDTAKELTLAGHYDHKYTLVMIKSFLHEGGSGHEADSFRFPLRMTPCDLEKALKEIHFMNREDADKHMSTQKLTYQDICDMVESEYNKDKNVDEWGHAKHAGDSKAPPSAFLLKNAIHKEGHFA